jgi:DNA-binding MarR family transcriptional regulator
VTGSDSFLNRRNDFVTRFEYDAAVPDLASPEINYEHLLEFRYLIRRFLRFSEEAAREAGVEPRQHQLLLVIKGMQRSPEGISVTTAAERLQISHNTAVELVDRAQAAGLVVRSRSKEDRRLVHVRLTPRGEDCLDRLSNAHLAEIRSWAPELIAALSALLSPPSGDARPTPR